MIFWVLFLLALSPFIAVPAAHIAAGRGRDIDGLSIASAVTSPISFIFLIAVWSHHASDLSKITSQHHRIEVYQERLESLERRLNDADYPGKSLVSVDADTPWATMMNELSRAETELAKAKSERATAILSVEARRYGPMSGVIWLVGDAPEGNDNG